MEEAISPSSDDNIQLSGLFALERFCAVSSRVVSICSDRILVMLSGMLDCCLSFVMDILDTEYRFYSATCRIAARFHVFPKLALTTFNLCWEIAFRKQNLEPLIRATSRIARHNILLIPQQAWYL